MLSKNILALIFSLFFFVKALHNFTTSLSPLLFALNWVGIIVVGFLVLVNIKRLMNARKAKQLWIDHD